jgi:predicted kinase
MSKVQVLVGMIASGKSTYAKNAARKGVICMNDDAIVNLLHADEYTLYSKSLKVLYKTIENQIIGTTLAMGRAVLIDRGLNCSIPGRQRWIALARSFDVDCEAIVFPHDGVETHARRRTDHDSRGHPYEYWLKVANAHNEGYVPPSVTEGFSAIHHVTFEEVKEGKVFS